MVASTLLGRAYDELNTFFTTNERFVVEITILPSALAPTDSLTLQDSLNIGVSKTILVQAFLKARELFFSTKDSPENETICLEATRVIILFDPEHLTAVNWRKERLERIRKACPEEQCDAIVLQHEVIFLDSILKSPLHRQTKSPTLWHHRTNVISMVQAHKDIKDGFEFDGSIVQTELRAVSKASERHPNNYYAWQHARRMLQHCSKMYRLEKTSENGYYESYYLDNLYQSCLDYTKEWCVQNPSDTSGWSFLAFLLRFVRQPDIKANLVLQVLDRAIGFNWQQESLWAFIRTALGDVDIIDFQRQKLVAKLEDDSREGIDNGKLRNKTKYIEEISTDTPRAKAIKWINQYSIPA